MSGCAHLVGWYALCVQPSRSRAVRTALYALGIETFHPVYLEESRWSDRVKAVERPLFPGYVFARFDPQRDRAVLDIAGLLNVLPNNLHPEAIPEDQIDRVRRVEITLTAPTLSRGDAIVITSGPWRGVNGAVTRCRRGERVTVTLGSLHVEFDADAVRLAA